MHFSYCERLVVTIFLCRYTHVISADKASLGFAIPVRELFTSQSVWRGVIYAILMCVGKFASGMWIILLPIAQTLSRQDANSVNNRVSSASSQWRCMFPACSGREHSNPAPDNEIISNASQPRGDNAAKDELPGPRPMSPLRILRRNFRSSLLLGFAMTTRGEIGFMIAAIAESTGTLAPDELYYVVLWGLVICTLLGPICFGTLVRRMAKVEISGSEELLGDWGRVERSENP
jgi:hypothetical protein